MVLFGVKDPAPPLQTPPVATVTAPFRLTVGLFTHSETSAPAFDEGDGVKLRVTLLLTALHKPLPVVVSVKVTLPLATSAAVGV